MNRLTAFLTRATIALLPLYLVRFYIGPLPSTLLEVLLLATVLSWLVQKFVSREPIQKLPRVFLIIASAFLLAATISIFTAPDHLAALGVWRAYFVEPLLFFLVVRDLLQKKYLAKSHIIFSLALSAAALSIYAIVQKYTGWGIPHPWNLERRVTSVFPYPNALALYLAPLIPLFLSQVSKKNVRVSVFPLKARLAQGGYVLCSLFSLLAIFFAQSTGALIGLGAGFSIMILAFFCLSSQRRLGSSAFNFNALGSSLRWNDTKRAPLLLLTLFFLAAIAVGTLVFSQPKLRNELLLKDWSGRVHKIGWNEAFTMLKDTSTPLGAGRPLLGAGLSGFPITIKPYHKATYLEIFQYPHNIVLNFWSETGALGLLSFIALVVYYFCTLFSRQRKWTLRSFSLVSAMVIILVHGLVDAPYFKNDLAVIFWLIYALGLETN